MIHDNAKPLALQAILYFVLCKMDGKTRQEAVRDFVGSPMCRAFGDTLTYGNVDGFANAGGYEKGS